MTQGEQKGAAVSMRKLSQWTSVSCQKGNKDKFRNKSNALRKRVFIWLGTINVISEQKSATRMLRELGMSENVVTGQGGTALQ